MPNFCLLSDVGTSRLVNWTLLFGSFDDETGAQVTTVFDFRPLVKRLIEEMNRDDEAPESAINIDISPTNTKKKVTTSKNPKGDDKNVRGEGDKNVTLGVTELAPGGVTEMSPKEYTNNNKNISKRTPRERSTYSRAKKNANGKTKEGVSKDFRDGIFRNRIFEIYDNLSDLKSVKELVGEGVQRAFKDLMVNRAKDFDQLGITPNIKSIVKKVTDEFPYTDIPTTEKKARNFYTATICNLVSNSVAELFLQKH